MIATHELWAMHEPSLRSLTRTPQLPITVQATPEEIQAELQRVNGGYSYEVDRDGIAVVFVTGSMIKAGGYWFSRSTSTVGLRATVAKLRADETVKGVVLHIDSPGGMVAGQHDLANDISTLSTDKPTIAYIEDLGASAAYWTACQCRKVYSNEMAIVGSIGTYGYVIDSSEAHDNAGVKVHLLTTGKHKGVGVPGVAIDDEQVKHLQSRIEQLNGFFLGAVAKGRRMSASRVAELATGETWIGKQAAANRLTDGVRTLEQVMDEIRRMPRRWPTGVRGAASVTKTAKPSMNAATAEELADVCDGAPAELLEDCQAARLTTGEAAERYREWLGATA